MSSTFTSRTKDNETAKSPYHICNDDKIRKNLAISNDSTSQCIQKSDFFYLEVNNTKGDRSIQKFKLPTYCSCQIVDREIESSSNEE
jgi:hypothetical protein